jgi:hypothetical protein
MGLTTIQEIEHAIDALTPEQLDEPQRRIEICEVTLRT